MLNLNMVKCSLGGKPSVQYTTTFCLSKLYTKTKKSKCKHAEVKKKHTKKQKELQKEYNKEEMGISV